MKTDKITEYLALDHFYVAMDLKSVRTLSVMTKKLRGCTHKLVKSGDDTWEGVYLHSRTGAYFELVHAKSTVACGLAMSARLVQYCDIRKIRRQFPKLKWLLGHRIFKKNQPWFDYLSIKNKNNSGMYAWLMHYHFFHRPRRTFYGLSVDRFVKLKLILGKNNLNDLKTHIAWVPKQKIYSSSKVKIIIPDREFSEFIVDIKLVSGDQMLTFDSLEIEPIKNHKKIKSFNTEGYSFVTLKNGNWLLRKIT